LHIFNSLSKDYHGFFALLQSKQQLFEIAFALNWPLSYSAGGLHQHCTLRSQFPDWECSLRSVKEQRSAESTLNGPNVNILSVESFITVLRRRIVTYVQPKKYYFITKKIQVFFGVFDPVDFVSVNTFPDCNPYPAIKSSFEKPSSKPNGIAVLLRSRCLQLP